MIHVEKVTSIAICCQCNKNATIRVNDMAFCPKHGDDILVRTVVKCTNALQKVTMITQLALIPNKKSKRNREIAALSRLLKRR